MADVCISSSDNVMVSNPDDILATTSDVMSWQRVRRVISGKVTAYNAISDVVITAASDDRVATNPSDDITSGSDDDAEIPYSRSQFINTRIVCPCVFVF